MISSCDLSLYANKYVTEPGGFLYLACLLLSFMLLAQNMIQQCR